MTKITIAEVFEALLDEDIQETKDVLQDMDNAETCVKYYNELVRLKVKHESTGKLKIDEKIQEEVDYFLVALDSSYEILSESTKTTLKHVNKDLEDIVAMAKAFTEKTDHSRVRTAVIKFISKDIGEEAAIKLLNMGK